MLHHFANTGEIHWFADCQCGEYNPNGMGECVDCGDAVAHYDNPELCSRCEEMRSEGDDTQPSLAAAAPCVTADRSNPAVRYYSVIAPIANSARPWSSGRMPVSKTEGAGSNPAGCANKGGLTMPEFKPGMPRLKPRRIPTWTREERLAASKFPDDNPHLDHTHLPDGTRMTVHYAHTRRKE